MNLKKKKMDLYHFNYFSLFIIIGVSEKKVLKNRIRYRNLQKF
jgi:hypothetical protein